MGYLDFFRNIFILPDLELLLRGCNLILSKFNFLKNRAKKNILRNQNLYDSLDRKEEILLKKIELKKKDKKDKKEKHLALVVEDDLHISKLIKSWLEIKGFIVLCAENGKIAIDLIEKNDFSIITTDIIMPGLDGSQLVNYIKSNPKTYNIPIIILSILDKSDLGNFFADAYLKKPFDGFDLLRIVDELTS